MYTYILEHEDKYYISNGEDAVKAALKVCELLNINSEISEEMGVYYQSEKDSAFNADILKFCYCCTKCC